jgi:predicted nuclease with TOPRIM domain
MNIKEKVPLENPIQAILRRDVLNYINKMGTSYIETAALFNISSPEMVRKWQLPSMKKESEKTESKKPISTEGEVEALQAKIERLEMENALLKKVEYFSSNAGKITNKIKAQVIFELKDQYEVVDLVEVADIPRSTYYYWEKRLNQTDKYVKVKEAIEDFHEHKMTRGILDSIIICYKRISFFLVVLTVQVLEGADSDVIIQEVEP